MQKLTYIEAAKIVLSSADAPLTSFEIWRKIETSGLRARLTSIHKTPYQTLHARLFDHNKKGAKEIFSASQNPHRFWLTGRAGELAGGAVAARVGAGANADARERAGTGAANSNLGSGAVTNSNLGVSGLPCGSRDAWLDAKPSAAARNDGAGTGAATNSRGTNESAVGVEAGGRRDVVAGAANSNLRDVGGGLIGVSGVGAALNPRGTGAADYSLSLSLAG